MRVPQAPGTKGSLKWIQEFVNRRSSQLDAAIQSASRDAIGIPIQWRSPLEKDQFAEYRDGTFLNRLGLSLRGRRLDRFWLKGGPQWDALGIDAAGASVLVEAKANVGEMLSPPTDAGENSLKMIREALKETEDYLGFKSTCD